uniref:Uncharacterized protein n=1 Tax=Oryza nivara TaxID=4536 RepID=A0A0E0IQH5_ORYNI
MTSLLTIVSKLGSQIIVAPVDEDAAASFNELLVFFYAKDGFSSHTNILASGVAVQQCHIFLRSAKHIGADLGRVSANGTGADIVPPWLPGPIPS